MAGRRGLASRRVAWCRSVPRRRVSTQVEDTQSCPLAESCRSISTGYSNAFIADTQNALFTDKQGHSRRPQQPLRWSKRPRQFASQLQTRVADHLLAADLVRTRLLLRASTDRLWVCFNTVRLGHKRTKAFLASPEDHFACLVSIGTSVHRFLLHIELSPRISHPCGRWCLQNLSRLMSCTNLSLVFTATPLYFDNL